MAHNGGTPRLLAKCGSAVEVLDKQQIEDPAPARVKRARTTGHTDGLPTMAHRTHLGMRGHERVPAEPLHVVAGYQPAQAVPDQNHRPPRATGAYQLHRVAQPPCRRADVQAERAVAGSARTGVVLLACRTGPASTRTAAEHANRNHGDTLRHVPLSTSSSRKAPSLSLPMGHTSQYRVLMWENGIRRNYWLESSTARRGQFGRPAPQPSQESAEMLLTKPKAAGPEHAAGSPSLQ